jgi:hypothetical protein
MKTAFPHHSANDPRTRPTPVSKAKGNVANGKTKGSESHRVAAAGATARNTKTP